MAQYFCTRWRLKVTFGVLKQWSTYLLLTLLSLLLWPIIIGLSVAIIPPVYLIKWILMRAYCPCVCEPVRIRRLSIQNRAPRLHRAWRRWLKFWNCNCRTLLSSWQDYYMIGNHVPRCTARPLSRDGDEIQRHTFETLSVGSSERSDFHHEDDAESQYDNVSQSATCSLLGNSQYEVQRKSSDGSPHRKRFHSGTSTSSRHHSGSSTASRPLTLSAVGEPIPSIEALATSEIKIQETVQSSKVCEEVDRTDHTETKVTPSSSSSVCQDSRQNSNPGSLKSKSKPQKVLTFGEDTIVQVESMPEPYVVSNNRSAQILRAALGKSIVPLSPPLSPKSNTFTSVSLETQRNGQLSSEDQSSVVMEEPCVESKELITARSPIRKLVPLDIPPSTATPMASILKKNHNVIHADDAVVEKELSSSNGENVGYSASPSDGLTNARPEQPIPNGNVNSDFGSKKDPIVSSLEDSILDGTVNGSFIELIDEEHLSEGHGSESGLSASAASLTSRDLLEPVPSPYSDDWVKAFVNRCSRFAPTESEPLLAVQESSSLPSMNNVNSYDQQSWFQRLLARVGLGKHGWCPTQKNAHVIVLRVSKGMTFSAFEKLVSSRIINATQGYPKKPLYPNFTQRVCALPGGFYNWVRDETFHLHNHVQMVDSYVKSEHDLCRLVECLSAIPLSLERPPWDCYVVPEYCDGDTLVVWRVHPVMYDGATLMHVFSEAFSTTTAFLKPLIQHKRLSLNLCKFFFYGPANFLSHLFWGGSNRPLKSVDKSVVAWSKRLDLNHFYSNKHVGKVSYNDVSLALLAGGLRSVTDPVEEAENLDVMIPVDLSFGLPCLNRFSSMNDGSFTTCQIPVSGEGTIPRIWEAKQQMSTAKSGSRAMAIFYGLRWIRLLMPLEICQQALLRALHASSICLTSLQLPIGTGVIEGHAINDLMVFMCPPLGVSMTVCLRTYQRSVRACVVADPSVPWDVNELITSLEKEVDLVNERLITKLVHLSRIRGIHSIGSESPTTIPGAYHEFIERFTKMETELREAESLPCDSTSRSKLGKVRKQLEELKSSLRIPDVALA